MTNSKKASIFKKNIEKIYGKDYGANSTKEVSKLLVEGGFESLVTLINGNSKDFYCTNTK
jgi:hypothetical protein